MRTVLMVAYHYPPEGSSSGVLRTLAFSRHLPEHGWRPAVLTADSRAYAVTRSDQIADVPPGVVVRRAFALDASRHLAIGKRYLTWTALPDRWVSWWFGAVAAGYRMARTMRPAVIWSTYPIATAHLVGWTLHRLTGLPWVADFRDTMTEADYPPDERQRRVYRWIERNCIARAARAVFTTPGALRMYAERYPDVPAHRLGVIENGFDEESFERAGSLPRSTRNGSGPLRLVHSGILYPEERNPTCLYQAVARLQRRGVVSPDTVRIVLRATGHDEFHRRLIRESGIERIVTLEPAIPYRDALKEMLEADGLLLLQGSSCNHQIPAKLYEYLRAGRPLLALTDPSGDTAGVLKDARVDSIAPLEDEDAIESALERFLSGVRAGTQHVADPSGTGRYARRARAEELSRLLDEVVADGGSL